MSRVFLDVQTESAQKFDFDPEETARRVCEAALGYEGCPYDAEVSLVLTEAEEIRRLNRDFRGIDRETDVLSFPNIAFPTPSDFAAAEENPMDDFDPESGCLILGDIVINTLRVREQAKAYGHSEKREFAFLTAHSMLHLCGYDHMTPDEASEMERRQEEILNGLGITRD